MLNPFIDVINQALPEPQASLLNGILFGVKTSLPKELYDAFIKTGTVHIMVLSGQNIAILTKIISDLTLPWGRKTSIWITVLCIMIFVWFVGIDPPVIRAAMMGSLSLLATYFGKQSWSLLSLILAAGIMLLIKPEWINSISFQLSFLATLGIILFASSEYKKANSWFEEISREIKINLRTTLAAQIATLPVSIFIFGQLSLVSPLSNLLIGWTITPIMMLGFLSGILGWVYLPLGMAVSWFVWLPLSYMIFMVKLTSGIPYASFHF